MTGVDAAARGDVVAAITTRFPAVRLVVAETRVQGPGATTAIVGALNRVAALHGVDVVILARGGGSFEDLLPFSDERVVRAVAALPVPVVSAVGHEQDEPLCDLAADVRAPTPTAAARLVVPDLDELRASLGRAGERLDGSVVRLLERDRGRVARSAERLAACAAALPRATPHGARSRGRPAPDALATRDAGARLRDRACRRRRRAGRGVR